MSSSRTAISCRNRVHRQNGRGEAGRFSATGRVDLSAMPDIPAQARTAKLRPFPEPKPPEPSEVLVYFVDPETLRCNARRTASGPSS